MTAEGTVPTVGTHAYIDTELSFEKDPAELGVPGSLDVDTHQTKDSAFRCRQPTC